MINKTTMPEPVVLRTVMPNDYRYGHVYGYTESHMKAYANARVRESLEEAAEIADRNNDFATYDAIRALIPKENT